MRTSKKRQASTKTIPYDVAEQLRAPKEMAAYLGAWLDEAPEDASGIARALGDIARAKGMTQVAKDAGLSRENLYRARRPELRDGAKGGAGSRRQAAHSGRVANRTMESICEFDVEDMPVTVAFSADYASVHNTGPRELQTRLGKSPATVA